MQSLEAFAVARLAELDARQIRRRLVASPRTDAIHITRDGRSLISFCCNDYLNLSRHPAVIEAAIAATRAHGVGAGASRLVTGNHPLFAELEARLARLKGTQDCVVFGSGYLANVGIVPTLAGADDLVLVDELAHACIWAGGQLSSARLLRFRHNDVDHCAALLAAHRGAHRHALVLTDGVFSMDGDLAPLGDLAALAEAHDAWLMSDDAHGVGVLAEGRGSSHLQGAGAVPLQMGTLSKAVGGYGGYLCASNAVVELMKTRARSFVYSTGLPPGVVAAASAALDVIADAPELCARPVQLARMFTGICGLPVAQSPIVPLILGEAQTALAASATLAKAGFLVAAIRPPTVPPGTARLRFTFTAAHTEAQVRALADAVQGLRR
jgi:8-amino-7-oxononanoate synthase